MYECIFHSSKCGINFKSMHTLVFVLQLFEIFKLQYLEKCSEAHTTLWLSTLDMR